MLLGGAPLHARVLNSYIEPGQESLGRPGPTATRRVRERRLRGIIRAAAISVVEDTGSPGKDILEEEATFASRDDSHATEPTLASGSYASGRTGDKTYETGETGAVARARAEHERDAISLLSVDEGLADDDALIEEAGGGRRRGGLTPVKREEELTG